MAVTPNYSWPVPVDTDLVKDGAEAIKDLGDAIDATVFGLPAPASGLTLINTTTVTSQSTVSFNNVFSATYQNYMIMVAATFTSDIVTTMRLRVGGVDTVGTDYENQFLKALHTTVSASRFTGDNTWNYGSASAGNTAFASITLTNPFAAARTSFVASGVRQGPELDLRAGQHTSSTSFDGISFLASSGTFTGKIRIYGVQN